MEGTTRAEPTLVEKAALFLGRLVPLRTPQSMANPGLYASQVEDRAAQLYESFYGRFAPFAGARVAEVGGTGSAINYYLTLEPEKIFMVNLGFDEAQREMLAGPLAQGKVEFVRSTAESVPLPDASVDAIISENTFEHIVGYDRMIPEFNRILRPGGVLMAKFSPLYYSPYGAHLYEAIKLPWFTLLFGDEQVSRMLAHELGRMGFAEHYNHQWEQFLSLNKLRPRQFLAPFDDPAWEMLFLESFPFRWSLRAFEPVQSLLTHGIAIAARKKDGLVG